MIENELSHVYLSKGSYIRNLYETFYTLILIEKPLSTELTVYFSKKIFFTETTIYSIGGEL